MKKCIIKTIVELLLLTVLIFILLQANAPTYIITVFSILCGYNIAKYWGEEI